MTAITRIADYYNLGDVFIAKSSDFSKMVVAYLENGKTLIAADRSVVDDYVHQQWLASNSSAESVEDICWVEYCKAGWCSGHRTQLREFIKEHQIKENNMKEWWNGVKSVYRKGDVLFLDHHVCGAHFNDVENTLYTYCFDDAGAAVADSDDGFREWCASHPDTVRAVVERFAERREEEYKESNQKEEEEEETKLAEQIGDPRLVSGRINTTIELEEGVILDTQCDLYECTAYNIAAWVTAASFRRLCSRHDPTGSLAVLDMQIRRAYEQLFGISIRQSCRDVHINDHNGQLWFRYTTPAVKEKLAVDIGNKITFN